MGISAVIGAVVDTAATAVAADVAATAIGGDILGTIGASALAGGALDAAGALGGSGALGGVLDAAGNYVGAGGLSSLGGGALDGAITAFAPSAAGTLPQALDWAGLSQTGVDAFNGAGGLAQGLNYYAPGLDTIGLSAPVETAFPTAVDASLQEAPGVLDTLKTGAQGAYNLAKEGLNSPLAQTIKQAGQLANAGNSLNAALNPPTRPTGGGTYNAPTQVSGLTPQTARSFGVPNINGGNSLAGV